jgi:hypothetical protein
MSKALTICFNVLQSPRSFFFLFFLSSLSLKVLLYALLHVIYNCRFQLHAMPETFSKLHKTFQRTLNFNISEFLLAIFHSDFHNFHSKYSEVNPFSYSHLLNLDRVWSKRDSRSTSCFNVVRFKTECRSRMEI